MFNPLIKDDPSGLTDQQIDDKIVKINKQLSHAYATQSSSAIMQLKNLLMIYVAEQTERMEVQMFKQMYETDPVVTLTVDDPIEEEKVENKPKVEEREGGKLSLFRKIMSEHHDKK